MTRPSDRTGPNTGRLGILGGRGRRGSHGARHRGTRRHSQCQWGPEEQGRNAPWLVNNLKVRTDIAIRATNLKLNAHVQLTNLQAMYEKGTATSDQRRRQLDLAYQDWARLQGRGPHTAGGHASGRNRHVGWQEQ
jgi:hypothetical protein